LTILRRTVKDNKKIYELELSHENLIGKNELVSLLMEKIKKLDNYASYLQSISELTGN